jgi:hypothetical protein
MPLLKKKIGILLLPIGVILFSCDHGISPVPLSSQQAGFSGKITFIGSWPDSIKRTFVVVFKDPLLAPKDFNIFNIKFISQEIPFGTGVYYYSTKDSSVIPGTLTFEPGEYAYVAVAQQSTDELSLSRRDWFVAGVYYNSGDTSQPGKLVIPEDTFIRNIDIICDFDHPPPQPPGVN